MSIARTELAPPGNIPALSEAGSPVPPATVPVGSHLPIPIPTRAERNAFGLSLLIHVLLLLVLAALLIPIRAHGTGSSIDGLVGVEDGDGEGFESVTIGSPDPGKGDDLEKTAAPTIEGVPAVEGALAGGSGSGIGNGKFDAIESLGSGGGGSGKGVGFFGTRARAESVVFVVDMSGSMNDGHRFQRAIAELIRSVNALTPTQKFFIFFYNNQTYPMFDQDRPKLVAATPGMRDKAIRWIKKQQPDGGTFPEDAIERALRLKPQVVYFLTDGEIPDTVRDTAQKWNPGKRIAIHTIAFESPEGADILQGIAKDNRGKYRFVQ